MNHSVTAGEAHLLYKHEQMDMGYIESENVLIFLSMLSTVVLATCSGDHYTTLQSSFPSHRCLSLASWIICSALPRLAALPLPPIAHALKMFFA